jgi:phytoene/squalene synthetase
LRAGGAGLVYLATADLRAHGLDEDDLRRFVAEARGDARWRSLVGELCARAQEFRARGEHLARAEYARLPSDRALVFRLIVEVYILLLERIQADPDAVLRPEPVVGAGDRAALVRDAALAAGFPLTELPSVATTPARRAWSLVTAAVSGMRTLFRRGGIARG